jgi:hypothetical protein
MRSDGVGFLKSEQCTGVPDEALRIELRRSPRNSSSREPAQPILRRFRFWILVSDAG